MRFFIRPMSFNRAKKIGKELNKQGNRCQICFTIGGPIKVKIVEVREKEKINHKIINKRR